MIPLPAAVTLVLVTPMLGAVLALLVRHHRNVQYGCALLVTGLHGLVSLDLGWRLVTLGPGTFTMGGIPSRYGVVFQLNRSGGFLLVMTSLLIIGTLHWFSRDDRSSYQYCLVLLLLGGMSGLCLSADLFTLYVFLEITGLSAYTLVAVRPGQDAAEAALKYLLYGTVGASFYLLGVGLFYLANGTLDMTEITSGAVGMQSTAPVTRTALLLMIGGLLAKIPVFPLHGWLPDAHGGADTPVSMLLSGLITALGALLFFRILGQVLPKDPSPFRTYIQFGVMGLAGLSILYGGLMALRQYKLKRLLAYSTIAHLGIVVLGFSLLNPEGYAGGFIHLGGHILAKSGLFALVGWGALRHGVDTLEALPVLRRQAPVLVVTAFILVISLIGIPGTLGFSGKWYLATAAAAAGRYELLILILVSSGISMMYFGEFLRSMLLGNATQPENAMTRDIGPSEPALYCKVVGFCAVCGLGVLALGLWSAPLHRFFLEVAV